MSDVFVSYKAEDRPRVRPLVEALEAQGLSVWWDAHIAGGDEWRETIARHLNDARCVIVVWSKRSVGPEGSFVRDEATRALRRGVYLPVLIDKVDPPLGFGETQALPLNGWRGNRSDPRYVAVAERVKSISGLDLRPAPASPGVGRRPVLLGGAAAIAAAGIGGWFLVKPGGAKANSIAVLPFANLSGDPAQAYFSDGIAEELRSALSRIAGLKVVARTSSEMVRDSDATAAARKLGVEHIVTGSVRRSPSMIRVSAQLIDGDDGLERWSEIFDRPAGDVLEIQTSIARKVAQALSLELGRSERSVLAAGATDARAQDLYLQAIAVREASGPNEANYRRAISLLDGAIKLDPRFADAYAQKAQTITDLTGLFAKTKEDFERNYGQAAAIARRAIELAPERARGHAALAAALVGKLDLAGGFSAYQEALKRHAGEVEVLTTYSFFMGRIGRTREAIEAADKAIAIDPLNSRPYAMRATALFYARNYREAAKMYRDFIASRGRGAGNLAFTSLANCQMMLGQLDEARRTFALAAADDLYRIRGEAILEARSGNRVEAERKLAELRQRYGDAASYQQGQILAQLGDRDRAFAALARSWEVRDPGLAVLKRDPSLDPLRNDPRLAALEAKLNFPR
jgi:serine/threonine-protein kinase